ncbi:hypothetical protein VB775_08040 [Pseudanabaena sp. CCNP1317]|nr:MULTISPECIES: hypothetical protein [Pseudanabaena]MEA5486763.1 hypothetical protein [Pseudanabaena sp. CCNP1317]WGS71120.1 hypothetical protein OA858_15500 [Pseudanabaena galeata CCNP1313]
MPDNIDYLQGIIERLTFHSEETGYTVARLKVPKAQDLITVVGNFANQAGQTLSLEGTWRSNYQIILAKFAAQIFWSQLKRAT